MYGAGAMYLDDCPVQRFIPIYLVVGIAVAIFLYVMGLIGLICQHKDPDHWRPTLSKIWITCEGFILCFVLAWFIAGECVCVRTFVSLRYWVLHVYNIKLTTGTRCSYL